MSKILNSILLFLILLSTYSCYRKNRVPVQNNFPPITRQEPKQTQTSRPPFTIQVNGQSHTVTPLFNYQISGLIASCHFSKVLAQYRRDELNIMDAGILWGSNLDPSVYTRIKFENNGVWLRYRTMDQDVWRQFDENRVSNNHLLCTDPALNKKIKALKRGDVVTIKGCLASYTLEHGKRGSSTVRTDRGDGACETVWVDDLTVLKHGNREWHLLFKICNSSILALILGRIIAFFMSVYAT